MGSVSLVGANTGNWTFSSEKREFPALILPFTFHTWFSMKQTLPVLSYLIIVIFFTLTQFLENKIYTQKTRKLRQNTQKIAHFLRYYGKIQSKLPIFRVKSVKNYTGQKKFTRACSWR